MAAKIDIAPRVQRLKVVEGRIGFKKNYNLFLDSKRQFSKAYLPFKTQHWLAGARYYRLDSAKSQ